VGLEVGLEVGLQLGLEVGLQVMATIRPSATPALATTKVGITGPPRGGSKVIRNPAVIFEARRSLQPHSADADICGDGLARGQQLR
jgi:hypothetical protein